jgi:hypothetical protein
VQEAVDAVKSGGQRAGVAVGGGSPDEIRAA